LSTLLFIASEKNNQCQHKLVSRMPVVEKILVVVPESFHASWYLKWVNVTVYCWTRCWFIL